MTTGTISAEEMKQRLLIKLNQVYSPEEREVMIEGMRNASRAFYAMAARIGNHPFIEFAGIMNEYIKACEAAHKEGIDFTQCNTHSGVQLPIPDFMIKYINEKLECIFVGKSIMCEEPADAYHLPCPHCGKDIDLYPSNSKRDKP